MIGNEVADKLVKIINTGSTTSAVNFPQCDIPDDGSAKTHRVLNVHKNVPGVLKVRLHVFLRLIKSEYQCYLGRIQRQRPTAEEN